MHCKLRIMLFALLTLFTCCYSSAVAQTTDATTDAKTIASTRLAAQSGAPTSLADKSWKVGKIVKEAQGTPVWTDPKKAAAEFHGFQYMGEFTKSLHALQVVPAEGRFYLSIYQGGLPAAGWDGKAVTHEWVEANAIADRISGWKKIDRSSQLEFPSPPDGSTILFDGQKHGHWKFGEVIDGLLQAGARTKKTYTDFKLHLEFAIPFKPSLPLSHPGRGNSGVLALGVYEIQVIDTFGLDPSPNAWQKTAILKKTDTWCGSIYGIRPPPINVCLPPLDWQTLDIEFTAAKFDGENKISSAVLTVHQNGVVLHDHIKLPSGTGGGPSGPRVELPRGPIYIQKHGNPVQYRNVWILE